MPPTPTCPICRGPLPTGDDARAVRPFCSRRCQLLDLDRWLSGDYRIPGEPADPAEQPVPGEPDAESAHRTGS